MKQAINVDKETYGEIFKDIKQRFNFKTNENLKTRYAEILN